MISEKPRFLMIQRTRTGLTARSSNIVLHHRHEAVVHVQLLVTVKKRWARIVRGEVHLDLLHRGNDDHVFDHASRWFPRELGQLEAVPVQVDWMRFITLVIEAQPVPSICTHSDWIGLREGFSVDRPIVYPVVASEFLAEDEGHNAARRFGSLRLAPKNCVVPRSFRWSAPPWRFAAIRVFDHDA